MNLSPRNRLAIAALLTGAAMVAGTVFVAVRELSGDVEAADTGSTVAFTAADPGDLRSEARRPPTLPPTGERPSVRVARRSGADSKPRPVLNVRVRNARIAAVMRSERFAPPAPVAVVVDAIGVRAPIQPAGVATDGNFAVPENVADVGWYRHGAGPGERGVTVLAGHVDSASQGPGAFFRLRELEPGARVQVIDAAGTTHPYVVVARRQVAKAELPADLWSRSGENRLALVTCGGAFDSTRRSYADNVVVYAVRA
jgi:Sortase domain